MTVGFVGEPDGSILVAAGMDADWGENLRDDPAVDVEMDGRSFVGLAEELDERDPRRARVVRELILRHGTPSEGLGRGPVFVIRPLDEG